MAIEVRDGNGDISVVRPGGNRFEPRSVQNRAAGPIIIAFIGQSRKPFVRRKAIVHLVAHRESTKRDCRRNGDAYTHIDEILFV